MAKIAYSQRLLRVCLRCRGCKFRPFSHANSTRLSLVCVYAWRFGQQSRRSCLVRDNSHCQRLCITPLIKKETISALEISCIETRPLRGGWGALLSRVHRIVTKKVPRTKTITGEGTLVSTPGRPNSLALRGSW